MQTAQIPASHVRHHDWGLVLQRRLDGGADDVAGAVVTLAAGAAAMVLTVFSNRAPLLYI